eukprot:CAMPEP_0184359956 /NCGR_PEP_ID=MMETSP1089-20130417/122697_1 /TAXON_ID=38269 ORGANISM="Gloeochaete wittrockiana, Strain SAG46.84" /NCGR_SAMPLE_ID=MMETSP1089 /ASSEMBLY_ACC=CAM_ASM_000445 /LENGTH=126 /DNA_ID=CAMNT_0026698973 /DNA_START=69 /DNA_END=446 /DNA_ORIENTATION=-
MASFDEIFAASHKHSDVLDGRELEQTEQTLVGILLKEFVADVEEHGDADVLDEDELVSVRKDGVPQEEDVLNVELSSKHQAHPSQSVDLRLDPEVSEVRVKKRVDFLEEDILDVLALGDDGRLTVS